jgi:hypothetical protein
MAKQVRRILIGLAVVLVCLTGLLAASSLVPDVGYTKEGNLPAWRLKRNTHIQLSVPEKVETGQTFSINGTLEKTGWNNPLLGDDIVEPFAYQQMIIQSTHFHLEVMTDADGHFSASYSINYPGIYEITASYAGDKLDNYNASSGHRLVTVTGQPVTVGGDDGLSGISRWPFVLVAVIAMVVIAWEILYHRLILRKKPENYRIRKIPKWLSIIMALIAISAIVFAILLRATPPEFTPPGNISPTNGIPTKITFEMPGEVNARSVLSVEGTLWQLSPDHETYTPLPGQSVFIEKSNREDGSLLRDFVNQDITDASGRFSGKVVFEKAGKYSVWITFYSADNHYSGSRVIKDITVNNEPPFSYWDSPGWLIVYGFLILVLILADRLVFSRNRPKENIGSVLIFKGLPAVLVVIEIVAFVSFMLQPQFAAVHPDEYASLPASRVTLEVPEKAEIKQSFRIQGTLTRFENTNEIPLPGQEIEMYLLDLALGSDRVEKLTTLVTDDSGKFVGEITVKVPGKYEISAMYENTEGGYYQSGDSDTIVIFNPDFVPGDDTGNSTRSPFITGVLVFIFLTAASFLLVRYGFRWSWYVAIISKVKKHARFKRQVKEITTDISMIHPVTPASTPIPVHTKVPPININFPQIPGALPDVWGKDESLIIVFSVEGTNQVLEQYSLDIEFGADSTIRSPINQEGKASQEHVFRKSGQYRIQAVLVKDVRNGYIPASRMVRIVDYREEIVRLYNEMVASAKAQGLILSTKMTARNVENRLRKAFPDLSSEVTGSLVSVFEEANYSLHPVSRLEYERMYRAVEEVNRCVLAK